MHPKWGWRANPSSSCSPRASLQPSPSRPERTLCSGSREDPKVLAYFRFRGRLLRLPFQPHGGTGQHPVHPQASPSGEDLLLLPSQCLVLSRPHLPLCPDRGERFLETRQAESQTSRGTPRPQEQIQPSLGLEPPSAPAGLSPDSAPRSFSSAGDATSLALPGSSDGFQDTS